MSKIFEALEQAQRDKSDLSLQMLSTVQEATEHEEKPAEKKKHVAMQQCVSHAAVDLESEMLCLYQNIDCLLPDTPDKSILFVGPQGGEGVSTIVREFARMAVTRLDKRVLIMDTAHHNPTQHLYFKINSSYGWKDVMGNGESAEKACHVAGNANLFLSPTSLQPVLPPQLHNQSATTDFLGEVKDKFNLLLVDASPVAVSPDSIIMSRHTDGVVIVIEAERTRWQVVESLRNKIVRNGGNVLGVVLNRRKYHIPHAIYRLLG